MNFIGGRIRGFFQSVKDFCVYKILHADDPPHTLALGIAIGMFVTFTPLIGFQMLLSVTLAWLLRANKAVGIPIVWISNPLTIIPIYYPCYVIGCKMLSIPVVTDDWDRIGQEWQVLVADPSTRWMDKVSFWWGNLMQFVGPLGLGCLVVGSVAGVLAYYISLYTIRQYRLRRWGQLMPPSTTPVESIDDAAIAKKESKPEIDASATSSEENAA